MTADNLNLAVPNGEPIPFAAHIASTGTDTQVYRVSHADPVAARVKWVKLYIHNTAAAAAELFFWDEDLTSGAVSTNSKQGANAVGTARFRVTVAADSQVTLTQEQLPGLWWQAGIAVRTDAAATFIAGEVVQQIS